MRLVPDGTPDPSPFMHNEMLYALAGASALSLGLHMGALALGPYRPPAHGRA